MYVTSKRAAAGEALIRAEPKPAPMRDKGHGREASGQVHAAGADGGADSPPRFAFSVLQASVPRHACFPASHLLSCCLRTQVFGTRCHPGPVQGYSC